MKVVFVSVLRRHRGRLEPAVRLRPPLVHREGQEQNRRLFSAQTIAVCHEVRNELKHLTIVKPVLTTTSE